MMQLHHENGAVAQYCCRRGRLCLLCSCIMEQRPRIGVLSLASYIPEPRMTSAELAEKTGIPRAVIEDKFGVLQKPMPGPEDHPCVMGARAGQLAIRRAGIDPAEIDVVI